MTDNTRLIDECRTAFEHVFAANETYRNGNGYIDKFLQDRWVGWHHCWQYRSVHTQSDSGYQQLAQKAESDDRKMVCVTVGRDQPQCPTCGQPVDSVFDHVDQHCTHD